MPSEMGRTLKDPQITPQNECEQVCVGGGGETGMENKLFLMHPLSLDSSIR